MPQTDKILQRNSVLPRRVTVRERDTRRSVLMLNQSITPTASSDAIAIVAERILALCIPEPNSGCLLYLGALDRDGYGCVNVAGKKTRTHRVVYVYTHGTIPVGLDIDHLCRTRSCQNDRHMEPVTRWENTRRGTSPVARNAAKSECKNGHRLTSENCYSRPGMVERQCRQCNRAAVRRYKARKRESLA